MNNIMVVLIIVDDMPLILFYELGPAPFINGLWRLQCV